MAWRLSEAADVELAPLACDPGWVLPPDQGVGNHREPGTSRCQSSRAPHPLLLCGRESAELTAGFAGQ